MKRFSLILLLALATVGCRPQPAPQPPAPQPAPQPQPDPNPQPTPAVPPLSVVIVTDATAESQVAVDLAMDREFRGWLSRAGHDFFLVDKQVSDEHGKQSGNLGAYVSAAKGAPWLILGRSGKVLASQNCPGRAEEIKTLITRQVPPKLGEIAQGQIWDGRHFRKLGLLPPKPGANARWPNVGESANEPLIPRTQWRDLDFSWLTPAVLDQDGYSCCAICSSTAALRAAMLRCGLGDAELSIVDLYSRVNGGSDNGAMLEDVLTELVSNGVCSTQYAKMYGVTSRQAGYKSGYDSDRPRHRILLAEWCKDADAIGSALQRGRPVVFGTLVNDSFAPDSSGVIGPRGRGQGGGHALYLAGARKIDGQWYFLVVNSWGDHWGNHGKAWLHESWCMTDYFQAWAISSVVIPSDTQVVRAPMRRSIDVFRDAPSFALAP